MKKIALIMLLVCALFSDDFDRIRGDLKAGISGKFIQSKHIAGFVKPIKTSGGFTLDKNQLIWSAKSPIKSDTKITKEGVFILASNGWQKSKSNVDSKLLVAIFGLDIDELKKSFEISLSKQDTGFSLLLLPKSLLLKQIFQKIKISGDTQVKNITITETSGDETVNEFYDVKPK